MKCREAQSLIVPFIKSELTVDQARAFIHHIDSCPECKEELEVYYILMVGLKQLDNEEADSLDLHGQFEEQYLRTKQSVRRGHLAKSPKIIVLLALVALILVLITIEQQRYVEEQNKRNMEKAFFESLPDYDPLLKKPEIEKEKDILGNILATDNAVLNVEK